MTSWAVIVGISMVGVLGLAIYNIRSLIRKWKHNPGSWLDLLMGILIWCAGIAAMVYIFIQQVKL